MTQPKKGKKKPRIDPIYEERRTIMVQRRKEGKPFSDIAEELGISHEDCRVLHSRVVQEWREDRQDLLDQVVMESVEFLSDIQATAYRAKNGYAINGDIEAILKGAGLKDTEQTRTTIEAILGHIQKPDAAVMVAGIKANESLRKLLGVDMPTKTAATDTVGKDLPPTTLDAATLERLELYAQFLRNRLAKSTEVDADLVPRPT